MGSKLRVATVKSVPSSNPTLFFFSRKRGRKLLDFLCFISEESSKYCCFWRLDSKRVNFVTFLQGVLQIGGLKSPCSSDLRFRGIPFIRFNGRSLWIWLRKLHCTKKLSFQVPQTNSLKTKQKGAFIGRCWLFAVEKEARPWSEGCKEMYWNLVENLQMANEASHIISSFSVAIIRRQLIYPESLAGLHGEPQLSTPSLSIGEARLEDFLCYVAEQDV